MCSINLGDLLDIILVYEEDWLYGDYVCTTPLHLVGCDVAMKVIW
jgi:hypothetical protein